MICPMQAGLRISSDIRFSQPVLQRIKNSHFRAEIERTCFEESRILNKTSQIPAADSNAAGVKYPAAGNEAFGPRGIRQICP